MNIIRTFSQESLDGLEAKLSKISATLESTWESKWERFSDGRKRAEGEGRM